MDTKIGKLLTCNRMHHPKADIERLYVPRHEGGRGLMQIEMNFKSATIGLHKYLSTTNDWMLRLVLLYDVGKKHTQFQSRVTNSSKNLTYKTRQMKQPLVHYRRKKSKEELREGLKQIEETWENKPLHGQYPQRIQQSDVDQEDTHQWLIV